MSEDRINSTQLEISLVKGKHDACKSVKYSFLGRILSPLTSYQLLRQNFLEHCRMMAERFSDINVIYNFYSKACNYCSQNPPKCDKVDEIIKNYEAYLKKHS